MNEELIDSFGAFLTLGVPVVSALALLKSWELLRKMFGV